MNGHISKTTIKIIFFMNTLLQFSDVHLQYQNGQNLTEVIKGISFSINQNERLAIVGKSGSGQICKACNQILVAQTIQSISEIITIARKSDINPMIIREALLAGYANSKILEVHGKRMITSDYTPGFKLSLHHKDLKIAKNLIKNMGINLKGLNQVQKAMRCAEREGLSDCDSSVIHTILEKTYK